MSEKIFKRIVVLSLLMIIVPGLFSIGINLVLQYVFYVVQFAGIGILIYAGFKDDHTLALLENDAFSGVDKVFERNRELVNDLLRETARTSRAKEEAKRLRTEIEIHRDQHDHNKCWMNDFRLHQTLKDGKTGVLPDPQKITLAEMLWGCKVYCPGQYQKLTAKDELMLSELSEVIKKYMY